MKISARNQLAGTISTVKEGAVNGVVTIDLGSAQVKADITMESIRALGLAEGVPAVAIVKASSVMFAAGSERITNLSARNQLPGIIEKIDEGAVNGRVVLALPDGGKVTGSITNEAIEELGLSEGAEALAVIKASDVMVGLK